MKIPDILLAVQPVIQAFEKISIPYYIGGSVASSVYGMARATLDVDVIADLKVTHIPRLKQILENKYYIDAEMIADAIRTNSSFNLIHLETMIKIDVFIHENEPYQNEALQRKKKDTLEDNGKIQFYFSSPEDIIIHKLQWYKMGGLVSERQWLDVIGVIKVQGDLLDKKYLAGWSRKLGLSSLLKGAFVEAGVKL
ncbi:MAG: hypothetical protein JRE36_13770 [Deltaproteobacteria bacterium]|nr:hypothetical protein [Deltaproteobacteria bacterium]